MTYELIVFTILTILAFATGLLSVFHYKPKHESTERVQTMSGLIWLTLATFASYSLLKLGGLTP